MATDQPTRIGPYEILGPLGKGGIAAVYKALQPPQNRMVVVKVLPPKLLQDPARVERIERETKAVSLLNHPNIVRILDKGQEGDQLYFVMEYIEGASLDQLMRQRRLTLQEALHVVEEMGKGLDFAHRHGIVHRDLKPQNVLVNQDLSAVKLADFGISRIETVAHDVGTVTTTAMSLGTLHYCSPEQATDPTKVDHRTDIYSLGAVFYEMLTGRPPVARFGLPSQVNPSVPSDVDPIVLRCLAHNPADRYPTVSELLADIEGLEAKLQFRLVDELKGISRSTSRLLHKSATTVAKRRSALLYSAIALIGVLALGGLGYVWLRGRQAQPAPVEVAATPSPSPSAAGAATGQATPTESPVVASPTSPAPQREAAATTPAPPEGGGQPAAKATGVSAAPSPTPQATAAPRSTPAPASKPAAAPAAPVAGSAPPKNPASVDAAARDLQVAQGKFDAKLYDQALADVQGITGRNPAGPVAAEAFLLTGKIYEALERETDAMAAYVEVQKRFQSSPVAAEAMYRLQALILDSRQGGREETARSLLDQVAKDYPSSPYAPRALVAKAAIEERRNLRAIDPVTKAQVPAQLMTYRDLAQRYPNNEAAGVALAKMAEIYEDIRRYDLAAATYAELGEHFPRNRVDAWFMAGELYERRVKDSAKAVAAYRRVPSTSSHYRDAQERAARLAK